MKAKATITITVDYNLSDRGSDLKKLRRELTNSVNRAIIQGLLTNATYGGDRISGHVEDSDVDIEVVER